MILIKLRELIKFCDLENLMNFNRCMEDISQKEYIWNGWMNASVAAHCIFQTYLWMIFKMMLKICIATASTNDNRNGNSNSNQQNMQSRSEWIDRNKRIYRSIGGSQTSNIRFHVVRFQWQLCCCLLYFVLFVLYMTLHCRSVNLILTVFSLPLFLSRSRARSFCIFIYGCCVCCRCGNCRHLRYRFRRHRCRCRRRCCRNRNRNGNPCAIHRVIRSNCL